MKKILISVIIILLIVLVYFSMARGITIGGFKALGIFGIKEQNNMVMSKIEEANRMIVSEYPKKLSDLESGAKQLIKAKEDYTDLTIFSSETQIQQAAEIEEYEVEYLWAKVGEHATREGIVIEMNISNSAQLPEDIKLGKVYDLSFTTNGSYIGTALFISSLENDTSLDFKIENFKLEPSEDGTLKSTFTVKGIRINLNELTQIQNNEITQSEEQTEPQNTNEVNKDNKTVNVDNMVNQ